MIERWMELANIKGENEIKEKELVIEYKANDPVGIMPSGERCEIELNYGSSCVEMYAHLHFMLEPLLNLLMQRDKYK